MEVAATADVTITAAPGTETYMKAHVNIRRKQGHITLPIHSLPMRCSAHPFRVAQVNEPRMYSIIGSAVR
ncbi:hypothetical protein D3C74_493500 [compost metagenome]